MRDFLKYTAASVLGLLIFLGLSIGGLVTLLVMSAAQDSGPKVKDKSVLVFDLSMEITDAKRTTTTGQALEEVLSGNGADSITLRQVINAINAAAIDPNIVALYLNGANEGQSIGTGFANLKEIREALSRFRAAGKRILAYDVEWREREYYLGSVADTIALNPIGSLELNGFSSETMFFAGALQKFGVGMQVTRVGKYKSAVEPFLMTKRSPESKEQTATLLNDIWQEFLSATGKDRQQPPTALQKVADTNGTLTAEAAKKAGLVTKIAYVDEMIAELQTIGTKDEDNKSFRQISLPAYARATEDEQNHSSNNTIAVVYAEGEIVSGLGGPGMVGGDRLAAQLRELRQEDSVKAIVLRVNSPGGSVTGSEVIQREVVLTRQTKPVVVSMGSMAASGGYWISTFSDRIFAQPNTITGSIGVFGLQPNIQALANSNGITWDVVKTGRYADSETLSRPKTSQELALLQKVVDDIYDQFLRKVSESRKLPKAKVAEIAQGRVWSGIKAKELGLVDELGGIDAAIRYAADRAKLGKDDWKLEEYPRDRSLEEQILEKLAGGQVKAQTQSDPLMREFKKVQADLSVLQSLNDPRGIYVRLPINFRID